MACHSEIKSAYACIDECAMLYLLVWKARLNATLLSDADPCVCMCVSVCVCVCVCVSVCVCVCELTDGVPLPPPPRSQH